MLSHLPKSLRSFSLLASLVVHFGGQATADVVNFTTAELFSDGQLDNHPDWNADADSLVDTSGNATASIAAYDESIYTPGEPFATGDVFNTSIDFSFTGADSAAVAGAPNKDILNSSFYTLDTGGDMLKVGLKRSAPGYSLILQTSWKSSGFTPPYTTGSEIVGGISDADVGITRDSDLQSDPLRLSLSLTRGISNIDWSITAKLYNISGPTDVMLAQLDAGGITFSAVADIHGGFGGGQSDSNSGTSNRVVDTFTFEKVDNSNPPPPVPPPLDPPAVGPTPADLNQNGIPDLAELITPALAEYPPEEDTDGDGLSNVEEVQAGTDPFDPDSTFGKADIARTSNAGDNIDFTFGSVAGVRYQIEKTESLESDDWSTTTAEVLASGAETTVSYSQMSLGNPDRCFFRASPLPSADSDSDGLEDSLELHLGFGTDSASSVRSASEGGDYTQFFNLLTGGSVDGGLFSSGVAGIPSDEQARRFLNQASFGANDDDVDALRTLGPNAYETWIDHQMSIPSEHLRPYIDMIYARSAADSATTNTGTGFFYSNFPHAVAFNSASSPYRNNLVTGWMRHAQFGADRLRQRVSWALSQIIVVSSGSSRYPRAHAQANDIFLDHAFGNYGDLLYEMSINPMMGAYLSSRGNQKADPTINRLPDENYAREIMQLFSIGLWELNMDGTRRLDINGDPIATYTNDDITQVARVFTGLDFDKSEPGGYSTWLATHPMLMNDSKHDQGDSVSVSVYGAAEKTFLQSAFYSPAPLPAFGSSGRTGLDDVRDTVDILLNHPNCPPFISKNLIQHLVTSNPSPEYVERIANVFADDGTGTRGNLGAVVKAILLDEEARTLSHQFNASHGRLKGPMLRITNLAKVFNAGSDTPALHDLTGIQFWSPGYEKIIQDTGEAPYAFPSVFNFYEPGYTRPGEISQLGMLSPEFQILNSLSSITMPNRFWSMIDDGFHTISESHTPEFKLKLADLEALAGDSDAMLDRLNLLLCNGTLGAGSRAAIKSSLDTQPSLTATEKAKLAIYLVMTTPDSAVLR